MIADDGHRELERRYRRLLQLFPKAYRRAWEEELLAVLLQAAHPGQRRIAPQEGAALLWQATKAWAGTAVSADRTANHRAAAILAVTLPVLLVLPAGLATATALLEGSSAWQHHVDLVAWLLWVPAAVAAHVGPPRTAHRIAALAVVAYVGFLVPHIRDGDTGTVSTSFGWLLAQVTAWWLLRSKSRVTLGRRLLWRERRTAQWAAVLAVFVVGAPAVSRLAPASAGVVFCSCTVALIVAALLALRTPVGRALLTAGSALFAGFVAGHGWWTGIANLDILTPTTNYPTVAFMSWLIVLPMLSWAACRCIGGVVARNARAS